jgi:signal transduction histidine kinase
MMRSVSPRFSVRRFFWLPLILCAVLALAGLTAVIALSWLSLDRLRPVQAHLAYMERIQDAGLMMEETLLKSLNDTHLDQTELDRLRQAVLTIAAQEEAMDPNSAPRLAQIAQRLAQAESTSMPILFETLARIRAVLNAEREHHDRMLLDAIASNRMELRLAVSLLVILPLIGAVALLLLRHRMEQPLQDLQNLFNSLSNHDFSPVPEHTLRGSLRHARPVFDSYNALVSRLRELEAEHANRERTLEHRVREASAALLAQSRELARAERLAAVGAVSAGLAHELRNPLAGIQLACMKLQRALGDSEQATRIAAVIAELKRVDHLLTAQVDGVRHEPEMMTRVNIATLVDELLALLRFQVPATTRLEAQIDAGVECVLPAAGLRQALLNLLLNAIQSSGDNGHILITGRRDKDTVVLSVSDDGEGFPDEMLRAGTRPFATTRDGGTGLGLPMVRRFTRDLDGDLEIENRTPRGARVTLRLPCRLDSGREDVADV